MSETGYIDRALIRLRRQYGKDEVVAALGKQVSDRDIENGKLNSELGELKYKFNESQKQTNRDAKVEFRKSELCGIKNKKIKAQAEEIKKLRQLRDKLMIQINQKNG